MAETVTIELEGLREVNAALKRLGQEGRGLVVAAARAGGEVFKEAIAAEMSDKFTRRTGNMARHLTAFPQVVPGRGGKGSVVRFYAGLEPSESGEGAPYWYFWERGFVHIGRSKKLSRALRRVHARRRRHGIGERPVTYRREFLAPAFRKARHKALQATIEKLRSLVPAAVSRARG